MKSGTFTWSISEIIYLNIIKERRCDSMAVIVTTLRTVQPCNSGLISDRTKRFLSSTKHPDWLWSPSLLQSSKNLRSYWFWSHEQEDVGCRTEMLTETQWSCNSDAIRSTNIKTMNKISIINLQRWISITDIPCTMLRGEIEETGFLRSLNYKHIGFRK